VEWRIISIGTMAANPLWGERQAVRTGHATTTLVVSGDRRVLVDPGLPAPAVQARLGERANLSPEDITDVFLTSFHPDARRALALFEDADWWISQAEREGVGVALAQRLKAMKTGEGAQAGGVHDPGVMEVLERDVALLRRCEAAPDELAEHIATFPLPGVTPGLTGLLLEGERFTTLICGDAIPTAEHVVQGRVSPQAADLERARASFEEAVEIADLLILGRDNVMVNPTKRPF
jgi:glyoxylase-like metal-dependent hydrolase (beta-lactamase superfamily II)